MAAGFLAFAALIQAGMPGAFVGAGFASLGAKLAQAGVEDRMAAQEIGSQGAKVGAVLAEADANVEGDGLVFFLAGLGAVPAFARAGDQDIDQCLGFLIGFANGHSPSGRKRAGARRAGMGRATL